EMLTRWAGEVGDPFVFVLKAARRITHERRLSAEAVPEAARFLETAACRAALEFRHESWFDDEVYEILRERGAALCASDTEESGTEGPPLVATGAWGYLRLRRQDYAPADLAAWVQRIGAQAWSEAFVFFKHEDEGKGPELAARFKELLPRPS